MLNWLFFFEDTEACKNRLTTFWLVLEEKQLNIALFLFFSCSFDFAGNLCASNTLLNALVSLSINFNNLTLLNVLEYLKNNENDCIKHNYYDQYLTMDFYLL